MVVGDVTTGTELLVIGGGPGGYVAAIRAAQLGVETTLVERDAVGGTCLNHGCIPSKALISATDRAHRAREAEHMGIHADPAVDLAGMVDWKDGVVDRLTRGVGALAENAGVTLVQGEATFTSADEVRVAHGGDGQGSETLSFEHAIVATGSRPTSLPGFDFDGERVLSSRHALALESLPDRLVVVGAGYIGMELATVFQKLGTDVVVCEALDQVLPGFAPELASVVRERAEEVGVDVYFGEAARDCVETADGVSVVTETEDGERTEYDATATLVAVGREPVTESLEPGAAGLETDEGGFLPTDERCETPVDGIYAVGDVAGDPLLAHAAMAEGEVAAEVIAGEASALDHRAIPAAVFTDPEVATVGKSEDEARDAGFDPVVGEMPLRGNGRALTLDDADGFVRLVADADDGFVLGGQVVGPEASEVVAEIGLAVELGARLEDLAATVHTHPTLSEAVQEAARAARGEAIHTT